MSEYKIGVIDYDGNNTAVEISTEQFTGESDNVEAGDKFIRLEAWDTDGQVILYPTVEQAQKIVLDILRCIGEVKHGSDGDA